MCLVKIAKNSFYRKNVVPSGGAVKIAPRYKDIALSGGTSITLAAGVNPVRLVVSGSVPASPNFGGGELAGGFFRTYVSGVTLSGTNTLPVMEMYKLEEGIGPTQGSFQFAYRGGSTSNPQRGNKMYVMSSYMDGNFSYLEENFDGADKTLGQFHMLGDMGTATLDLDDAYLDLNFAAGAVFQGGDNFGQGGSSTEVGQNMIKFFSSENNTARVYIRPNKPNQIEGLWTAADDRRTGKDIWAVYKPYWKWDTIKAYIKYSMKMVAVDDIDANKQVTENNTIFSHITSQAGRNNPLTMGEESPLLYSTIELSTTKKVSGGQSCRFYHIWEHCPSYAITKNIERGMGKRGVNPQVSKACIYNIPEPPPAMDMGAFNYSFNTTDTTIGQVPASGGLISGTDTNYPGLYEGAHLTDKRLTFPEINVTMNIAQLYPSPQIEVSSSQATAFWGVSGQVYGYAQDVNMHLGSAGAGSLDRAMWASTNVAAGTTGYGANGIFSNSKGGLTTLLRSVAITFSNYKPDDYPTLDEFLAESLDDTYFIQSIATGSQKNVDTDYAWYQDRATAKVASGIIFQTFRGTSEYGLGNETGDAVSAGADQDINPEYIYCAALPMARYQEHTAADKGIYASGGFVKFDNAGLTYATETSTDTIVKAGDGGMTLVWDPRIGLEGLVAPYSDAPSTSTGSRLPAFNGATPQGRPWGDSGSTAEPLWVAIPKDSWFNLKFVFDSQANACQSKGPIDGSGGSAANKAPNTALGDVSGGTYSYSVGTGVSGGKAQSDIMDYGLSDPSVQFGVPLRVYISGAINNASGTSNDNIPYLNIPLPMRRSTLVSDDGGSNWYRGNNAENVADMAAGVRNPWWSIVGETFPYRYMTVWVNNYRHTSYVNTEDYDAAEDAVDYPFWRGTYFDGDVALNPQPAADTAITAMPAAYRAADSKLYPSGLNSETEVYIDNITFKNWNNEHVNHSIESGPLARFITLEQEEVLSPAQTFFNTGNIYQDQLDSGMHTGSYTDNTIVGSGAANQMTSMMKGFNNSGAWRAANPGRFLSFGFDNPEDLPLEFNADIQTDNTSLGDGLTGVGVDTEDKIRTAYLLCNNFNMTGDFGSLERLVPDIAMVSTPTAMRPNSTATNQAAVSAQSGTVNYANGFARNAGAQIAGRNFAIFNPTASGGAGSENMRTKQSQNIPNDDAVQFDATSSNPDACRGWIINNQGEWFATPDSSYPALYSNVAGWVGAPSSSGASGITDNYKYAAASGAVWEKSGGDTGPTTAATQALQRFYPGFGWLKTTGTTTQDSDGTTGNVSGSGGAINMGTGNTVDWLSSDGLTQKGFIKADVDIVSNRWPEGQTSTNYSFGVTSGASWSKFAKWCPRENILCSAKITAVPQSVGPGQPKELEGTSLLTVDDTSIFNASADDRYVIFSIGRRVPSWDMLPNDDGTYFTPDFGGPALTTNTGNSTHALGYHTMVKLSNIKNPIQGNTVALTVTDSGSTTPRVDGILRADDPEVILCNNENLSTLWISPLKYWLIFGFFSDGDLDVSRQYESICTINERPSDNTGTGIPAGSGTDNNLSGSTFNESVYFYASDATSKANKGESGIVANPWGLQVASSGQTSLDLQDYGYGAFEDDNNQGGAAGVKAALRQQLNYINIDGIVSTTTRAVDSADEPVCLTLGLSDESAQKEITIMSDEFAVGSGLANEVYKPTFIWRYYDALPSASDFSVSPSVDAISKGVNLYDLTKEKLNSVTFKWSESSDSDVWYRLLMVDELPIINKYHKAKLWIPLNETPNKRVDTTVPITAFGYTATTHTWYSDMTSSLGLTSGNLGDGGAVVQSIDGLAGYAPVFGAATDATGKLTVTGSANNAFQGLSQFTCVMHIIPNAGTVGSKILFDQGTAASNGINCTVHTNEKIRVRFNDALMESVSTIPSDGETPMNIIITYLSGSSTTTPLGGTSTISGPAGPDLQLFINGKREDYIVTGSGNTTGTDNLEIGGTGTSANFTGKIEEFIIYEKRYEVVDSESEYIFPTTTLKDNQSNSGDTSITAITNNAKLFVFDYHNIRGKESTEVCESNPTAWRTTS